MKFAIYSLAYLLFTTISFAQKKEYLVSSIPDSLKFNANAVVRLDQTDVTIESQREMTVNEKRVVTVFNEKGQNAIGAYGHYNKKSTLKSIEAIIYDAFGNELKKIKKKDFKDQSLFDGISMALDGRVMFMDYTPIQYPFTVVFESEFHTSTTAFIPSWQPLGQFFVSVEKSVLNVNFPNDLGFNQKEFNFSRFKIEKTESAGKLSYVALNIPAQREEFSSPDWSSMYPKVMMGLQYFHLEGVDGNAKDWKEFGKWYNEKILSGTTELSEETKAKMISLVGDEKDPIQKARIVYDFVQQKSRYVSIQLGIGGWKPMLAKDVDRLGYGDCKALTNYTKALLEVVGVPSYNTILYGDQYRKKNIQPDMVSVQGNHMILAIPNGDQYIWLECTSQDMPFGYQANFTDDRDVLVVKPDGAEIVHTKKYDNADNSQISKGSYALDANGQLSGSITMVSQGAMYSHKYRVGNDSPIEKEKHYKEFWSNINNLKIKETTFSNDKINSGFTENITISAENYGVLSGAKMIIAPNAFNQLAQTPKRIRNRKNPFQIMRGQYMSDEIIIELPTGYTIESLPENYELDTKFGKYKTQLIKKDNSHLVYVRSFSTLKGLYSNKEYEDFRLFMEQVAQNDNAKIILAKI